MIFSSENLNNTGHIPLYSKSYSAHEMHLVFSIERRIIESVQRQTTTHSHRKPAQLVYGWLHSHERADTALMNSLNAVRHPLLSIGVREQKTQWTSILNICLLYSFLLIQDIDSYLVMCWKLYCIVTTRNINTQLIKYVIENETFAFIAICGVVIGFDVTETITCFEAGVLPFEYPNAINT